MIATVRAASLLLPLFASARAQGTDVDDFRKFFPKLEKPAQRLEAVLALEKVRGPEVVDALLPVLKDEDGDVRNAVVKVLAGNDDPGAVDALVATLKKKDSAIRAGACQALGLGKRASARADLEKLVKEKDWIARARASEALGRIGDAGAVPSLLPALKDPEVEVRIAAADALGALGDESAGPALIAALTEKEWRLRASAIAALARVRTRDAIEPLVKIVSGDEGRLIDDAARTLKALSGRDFGRDGAQWVRWWKAYSKEFKLPTAEELAKAEAARERAPKSGETGVFAERKITEFLGVETPSKKILFIIDCSGSMEDLVIERERYKDRNYPGYRKIDIAKEELARTIERLDATTNFALATFATKVKPWKKGTLLPANPVNRLAAIEFARSLEPIGGHSKEELASAGFGGAAALGEGKTNTYGALSFGLGSPKRGELERAAGTEVDTIFFLSDGKPSEGELVDTDDILAAVKEANRQKKITIHVFAIGEFEKGFMRMLAEQNSGTFVDLGK